MENLTVRRLREGDSAATARAFFNAVHHGTGDHYDERQRNAWAGRVPETEPWAERLTLQDTFVAESNGTLVGFMTLAADGYIDLAFVAPEMIGKGVALLLYEAVEREACNLGVARLNAEASFPARSFFERQGWSTVREQTVTRNGVSLTNFVMEKHLLHPLHHSVNTEGPDWS